MARLIYGLDTNAIHYSSTQLSEFPTAAADYEGLVYQYIGNTTENFINGFFYKCTEVSTGVYAWKEVATGFESTSEDTTVTTIPSFIFSEIGNKLHKGLITFKTSTASTIYTDITQNSSMEIPACRVACWRCADDKFYITAYTDAAIYSGILCSSTETIAYWDTNSYEKVEGKLYTAGEGIDINGSTITNTGIKSLAAGEGISVSGNTITNTGIKSLAAGSGISVSGNTITNTGVRTVSTGGANGTISVNGSDVSVKGLANLAYATISVSGNTATITY